MGRTGDEIFPKQYEWSKQLPQQKQTGNWLNMPYFSGDDTTRYALNSKGDALSIEEFVRVVKRRSVTEEDLDKFVAIKKNWVLYFIKIKKNLFISILSVLLPLK